jgi:hypothetical protein
MAQALVCDLIGKVCKDEAGIKTVAVPLSPDLRLEVSIYKRTGPDSFAQGEVCAEGAAQIMNALSVLSARVNGVKAGTKK